MLEASTHINLLQPIDTSRFHLIEPCQAGTREHIVNDVLDWAEKQGSPEVMLWIHGNAGIGKSAITALVRERLAEKSTLAASFFCKRDDPELRDPSRLVNTVIHGLAAACPEYAKLVASAIEGNQELCTSQLDIRFDGLLKKPLRKLEDLELSSPLIVLIDALDECATSQARELILDSLQEASRRVSWLKIIITSRPDEGLPQIFERFRRRNYAVFDVHKYDSTNDIQAYMETHLGDLARKYQWPEDSISRLSASAGGSFVWAAVACRFLLGTDDPFSRLNLIAPKSHPINIQPYTPGDLDTLYHIVARSGLSDDTEDSRVYMRRCIGTILAVSKREPVSTSTLGQLMRDHIDSSSLSACLKNLDAVLHEDAKLDGAIRFCHPSFADYVADPTRFKDFYSEPAQRNAELATACLRVMIQELRFNICGLETSHLPNSEVPDLDARVRSNISNSLYYSCVHWIEHLVESPPGTSMDEVNKFLHGPQLLYWLEVLGLTNRLDVTLESLLKLIEWLPMESSELLECAEDAYKFASMFSDAITTSTPHLYLSGLALAPKSSGIVRRLAHLFPNTVTVTRGGDEWWPGPERTLPHSSTVALASVSQDGKTLVTICTNRATNVWDLKTGKRIAQSSAGCPGSPYCVAISPNGDRGVCDSEDGTFRIWDTATGSPVCDLLVGHSNTITCLAFSPNGDRVASGSSDATLRMWETKTGIAIGNPFGTQSQGVCSIAFSPDGNFLFSGSSNGTLHVWDSKTGNALGNLLGHTPYLNIGAIEFSSNKGVIASGSGCGDGEVLIWRVDTNDLSTAHSFYLNARGLTTFAFSPDGNCLATCSWDRDVRFWHSETGIELGRLRIGRYADLYSIKASPGGSRITLRTSSSVVETWRFKLPSGIGEFPGPRFSPTAVTFSPDGSRIACGSQDMTVGIWDAKSGQAVNNFRVGEFEPVRSVSFSPDSSRIVSGSQGELVRMWDTGTGDLIHEYNPPVQNYNLVQSIAFPSRDNRIVLYLLHGSLNTWDTSTGDVTSRPLIGHNITAHVATLSNCGSRLATAGGIDDYTLRMWDPNTGEPTGDPLAGHSDVVTCLSFSFNGDRIVSGSKDKTLCIWDSETGDPIGIPLVGHSEAVYCAAFSHDGDRIASGSCDQTVRIWDTKKGETIGCLIGHTAFVHGVAFSPDGELIVSCSADGTLRVWDAKADSSPGKIQTTQSNCDESPFIPPSNIAALHRHPVRPAWASHDQASLLLWLPKHYRRPHDPRARHCISADPAMATIYLDFSKFVHGTSWTSVASESVLRGCM